jgi:hypothetical protein
MMIAVTRIEKRGHTYRVEGVVDGTKTSFTILASDVESMTEATFREKCLQYLYESREYEKAHM